MLKKIESLKLGATVIVHQGGHLPCMLPNQIQSIAPYMVLRELTGVIPVCRPGVIPEYDWVWQKILKKSKLTLIYN